MRYTELSNEELVGIRDEAKAYLAEAKAKGLSLDLTRGKPGRSQLDITTDMLSVMTADEDCFAENGFDCRNYGLVDGIPEAKRLFAELLGLNADNIIIGGNASLALMYDAVSRAMIFGVPGGDGPWSKAGTVKFLCPAPGYDRHFAICKLFGIEMIPVTLHDDGPDMDEIENHIGDPAVKGMWCVPKFSNPDGVTYSDEVVERLAAMKPAAPDFRIFWDNAYAVHELTDEEVPLADIFAAAARHGNEDMIYYFASTSKISFPGAGVAIFAASEANIKEAKRVMTVQTIGYDKLNMLRHVKYFGNAEGVMAKMRQHAALLKPKFDIVTETFARELGESGIARWTEPKGGYFVSLYVLDGCAKRVYALCVEAGVKLTSVGAAYPYGNDPRDSHLRIAPSFPDEASLKAAIDILCACVKQAAAEKLLGE